MPRSLTSEAAQPISFTDFALLSSRDRCGTLLTDLLFLADVVNEPADDEEAFIFREDIETVGHRSVRMIH
jgi:hypothetical protein